MRKNLYSKPTADYNNIIKLNNSIKLLENYTKSLSKQLQEALNISGINKSAFGFVMSPITRSLNTLLTWTKAMRTNKEKEIAEAESAMAMEQKQPIASAPTQKPIAAPAMASWYKTVLDRLKGREITPAQQTITTPVLKQETKQPAEGLVERMRRGFWSFFGYK